MKAKSREENSRVFTHRVVDVRMSGDQRIETPIGKGWQKEKDAKDELNTLKKAHPNKWLSLNRR